ncbi:recombinase family protein [Bacillus alkalicellulosilyticus]|uniref:recombinase family protein n=1 Tax=Alkalihalobacterium alkalicellulosilyticum TaxID=1912214 RepID=UPI00099867DF|nr:recombinase family protein [Bacillus alkalicellulosilyticus]
MTIYGYARVSTKDQNLETQLQQLQARKCDVIIEEKMTGATFKRPKLEQLLKDVNEGDTIIVTRVDRLGRNTQQLLQLVEDLQQHNISLYIIELGIEATHRNGKLFLTILSALAENERELLAEKRTAGLENAKAKGVKLGRKGIAKGKLEHALTLWKQGDMTIKKIEESTGVGKSILYREIQKRGLKREEIQGAI